MESINKIELAGVIGSSRITTVSGKEFIRLSVATNHSFKAQDGSVVIETTWHNIVYWGKQGQDLTVFSKGTKIHVLGRLKQSRYTASDGTERSSYEVLAHTLELVS